MGLLNCDVLIIGSGAAGLKAAVSAKKKDEGADILLITKKRIGGSGASCTAISDRMAYHATLEYTDPGGSDAWKYHSNDIYDFGMRVSSKRIADTLAQNAAKRFYELVELGVPFVKKGDRFDQFVTDGSEYARACYTGPDTSLMIHKALREQFFGAGIRYIENSTVLELVKEDGVVTGAVFRDDGSGEYNAVQCKAVVIASGGGCGIFEHNVFPSGMTGEGIALAYDAGASLVNLEFMQFGPASVKTKINLSGSFFRAMPRIINDLGEEILEKYLPEKLEKPELYQLLFNKGASWPVSDEHDTKYIDIAIYRECSAGRKVYMDFLKNPAGFDFEMLSASVKERYSGEIRNDLGESARCSSPLNRLREINPDSIEWMKKYNIDLTKDKLEIAECAQHFQGGILIDEEGRTNINNLFAAGECAGGQHGANRPGGNALLDTQVFGAITGENAVTAAAAAVDVKPVKLQEALEKYKALDAAIIIDDSSGMKDEIKSLMQRAFAIVRSESNMLDVLGRLEALSGEDIVARSKPEFYEIRTMLTLSKLIAFACISRKESRGCHLYFMNADDKTPAGKGDGYEKCMVFTKDSRPRFVSLA